MTQALKAKILDEKDKKEYNHFVERHVLGTIHQMWEWGIFQSKNSQRDAFWTIVVVDKEGIVASALVIKQKLPHGKCWLYCPRGPLANYDSDDAGLKLLLEKIREIAQAEDAIFLRIDPAFTFENKKDLKELGFKKAHAHYQPEHTLILDLSLNEAQLLAQMKPKGRYNIKVAQKHGVKVRESDGNIKDIESFFRLLAETTSRDGFSGHSIEYYQNMLKILGTDHVKLYLAEYKEEIVAGIMVTLFKDTAIYYFGVSGNTHRQVMAPYLLQWKAICDAKARGLLFYDFLGISPENDPKHAWAGVTDFKLKFGGKRVQYQPAQELVYQGFWYQMIKLMKKLRTFKASFYKKPLNLNG